MEQQTSKAVRGPDSLEKRFGADDTRHGHCDKHGDYVDVHYSAKLKRSDGWEGCPGCRDDERLRLEREERAQWQKDQDRKQLQLLIDRSFVPGRFVEKSFDDYVPQNDQAKKHLDAVMDYGRQVAEGNHEGRCLILTGNVGTGKTHLACALVISTIRATRKPCRYFSFSDLVRTVKSTFNRDSEMDEQDVYHALSTKKLLVIDEVGQQNFTEFEQAVAYEAINCRYQEMLPTVVVTNLAASKLADSIGDRAVDRLRENGGKALDFNWKSYRAKR